MMFWSSISLKAKLTVAMTGIALFMMMVSMFVTATRSITRFRATVIEQSEGIADIMAQSSGPIIAFGHEKEGEEALTTLKNQSNVIRADLYQFDLDGSPVHFASFQPERYTGELPPLEMGSTATEAHYIITRPVLHAGESFGWVQLVISTNSIDREARNQFITALVLLVISSLAAYLLANRFVRLVSGPIDHLGEVAKRVSIDHDYTHRAKPCVQEEMNTLSDAFNNMLDHIEERDAELNGARRELEARVQELGNQNEQLVETRKREVALESRLDRAQRMESLGVLAGGVAHDLNNILGPIVGYPDILLDGMSADDPMTDDLIQIRNAATKAKSVVQDLLTLGRRGNYNFKSISLNDVVTRYLKSPGFRQIKRDSVTLNLNLSPETWPIKASSSHLDQVIMNLVLNGLEAMEGKGILAVFTQNVRLTQSRTGFETIPAGEYVQLIVADTGEGMPQEYLENIFEPFFSRKKIDTSGSGLGLAVVYGVAKDHGVFLDIQTEREVGTSFTLYFPRSKKPIETDVPLIAPVGGAETILIVDDIAAQRNLSQRILNDLGYRTSTAASGRDAVTYMHDHEVDLVLLDMVMEEDFDGLDTFREVRALHPDQKCIIVSGYSDNDRIQQGLSEGVLDLLSKPFTKNSFAQVVRKHLDPCKPPAQIDT